MPSIQVSPHLNLHYLDHNPAGSSTVLLLHGLGASGASWGYQAPALSAAGYRVIAPDARGFGKSTCPPGAFRIADMAQDFICLLEQLETGPVDVVGISLGGVHALELACAHPGWVKKLALVNTFAQLRPELPSDWLYFAVRFVLVYTVGLPAQAKAVAARIFPGAEQAEHRQLLVEQICQADPHSYRTTMLALALFNRKNDLATLRMPTLVVTAENDTTVSPKLQQVLVDRIPGAKHVTIAQAGHAVIADQPELFNQTLLEFLAK